MKNKKPHDSVLFVNPDKTVTNKPLLNDIPPLSKKQKIAYSILLLRLGLSKQEVKELIKIMK